MKKLLALLLIITIAVLPSCTEGRTEVYTAYTVAMDTSASVTVYGGNKQAAEDSLRLFEQLDKELSVTGEGSLVYFLNKNGEVTASDNLLYLVNQGNILKQETNGAFNPCIYPLVRLWGFTTDDKKVPSASELEAAVTLVSASDVSVERDKVRLSDGALLDLGGIAKGYASDLMAQLLAERGVESAIISLGGNVKTLGTKPNGAEWIVGINSPKGNGLVGTVSVGEMSIVTSGSYLRNFTENGQLYHHIIDPATGYPADSGLVSVTVIAPSATLADGLSTAFFVMGKDKAAECAEKLGVDVVFITESSIFVTKGIKEKFTPDSAIEGVYTVEYIC